MRLASVTQRLAQLIGALTMVAGLAMGAPLPSLSQPAPPAEAAERAQRLDELFARIKAAKEETEGDTIVAEIWRLWLQSGRAEIGALMQQAVLLMAFDPSQALRVLDAIVQQAPDWAEGWNKRATALFLIDEHDRSLADIDRVLALEPRHFGALAGRGLIYVAKDADREALAAFRSALAVNPFLKERFGIIPALEKKVGEKRT